MTTYTAEQRAQALQQAQQHGAITAAQTTGIHRGTITRWARAAHIILPAGGRKAQALRTAALDAKAEAEHDRAARLAATQAQLPEVAARQVGLAAQHQTVSERLAVRLLGWLDQLDDIEARLRPDAPELPPAVHDALMERRAAIAGDVDRELERARKAAIALGIHVDKVLRLAGEEAPLPGGGVVYAPVTALIMEDPALRRDVARGLRDRWLAAREAGVIESRVVDDSRGARES